MFLITVDLLGLLRWQEVVNDQTQLKKHLEQLMRVDGEEIVKVFKFARIIKASGPACVTKSVYVNHKPTLCLKFSCNMASLLKYT